MKKRIRLTKEEMELIDKGKLVSAIKAIKQRTDISIYESRNVYNNYKNNGHRSTTITYYRS